MSKEYPSYEEVKQYVEKEMRKKDGIYEEVESDQPALGLAKMLEADGFRYEMRRGKRYLVYAPDKAANIVPRTEEKLHTLEYLSGKTIDELIRLFAAGWTLEPPEKPPTFSELLSMMDKE